MKHFFSVFFLLFFCLTAAAQVAMKMELNQNCYLRNEPIFVRIAMRNLSAHPLVFGEAEGLRGSLRFEVVPVGNNNQKAPLFNASAGPELTGTILPAGGTVTQTFCLSKFYDMRSARGIGVKAVLTHPQLRSAYESNSVTASIVSGRAVWGPVTVGVPKTDETLIGPVDPKNRIDTRSYTVVSYFTGKVTVYALVIEDPKQYYLIKRIGFDLGSDLMPRCEIDFLSRLHIMVAASPSVFAYYQYDVDGHLLHRQIYLKTATTPKLVLDKETGIVMPAGGREAQPETDYEEIKDLPFMEDLKNKRIPKPVPSAPESPEVPAAPEKNGKTQSAF